MQECRKLLPIGVDRFEDLRLGPYHYLDKSLLLYEIIKHASIVNMIPRPGRFGRSLNLSMLRQFLSIGADPTLFEGLQITQYKDFCNRNQGKYPVLYLDLKGLCIGDFPTICRQVDQMLCAAAQSFSELATSPALDEKDLREYDSILHLSEMPQETQHEQDSYVSSQAWAPTILTRLLYKHYRKKVVVLIDAYNDPLNYACCSGLYEKVDSLLRGLFHRLLKGNAHLRFAVLTGDFQTCKGTAFAGLNNFYLWDSSRRFFGEYFGFTEDEVQSMLAYYGIPEKMDSLRASCSSSASFSRIPVYCPGDVLRYAAQCIGQTAGTIPRR